MNIIARLIGVVAFAFASVGIANGQECSELKELFSSRLQSIGGLNWTVTQLKREDQVWHLVFAEASDEGVVTEDSAWMVATRHSKERPDFYCTVASGRTITGLVSLHNSSGDQRFGMPGSGHPRCSRAEDLMGGFYVRAWASRELGDSLIFDYSNGGGPSLQLLMSKLDNHWILLEQEGPSAGTCYFDRGNDFSFREFSRVFDQQIARMISS